MTATETIPTTGGDTVTITVRTGLTGTSASWLCQCGEGADQAGRRVSTVAVKQAAGAHAAECDGSWREVA